ncbi:hypothetical protein [Spirosoma endophyticum]|uniref:Uncharacterized protein n=1 Tax=Spirosoma endophyticum TaxID=662367 RepID=A0A1I2DXM9_9BACT|nr:hypothetical protein [Spirosoma endophyticum]SFE84710.1 hypothetical protein SAMN05216167_12093 [Spirosoma endophyticum]
MYNLRKATLIALALTTSVATAQTHKPAAAYNNADFTIKAASITYDNTLDMLIFEMQVEGAAGRTVPKDVGSMNGAPVLAYVFPTTLKPTDVGFSATDGIVALGLTSHPDMDDTPLWDENNDGIFDNDGVVWHPHWVVLTKDNRVPGGLSVKEFKKEDKAVTLPKTAPGVPMYFDSPGYNVVTRGKAIRMGVPAYRVNNRKDFNFDAVSCYMEMSMGADHASHEPSAAKPTLGVYAVYTVLSGKLTLPYTVKK